MAGCCEPTAGYSLWWNTGHDAITCCPVALGVTGPARTLEWLGFKMSDTHTHVRIIQDLAFYFKIAHPKLENTNLYVNTLTTRHKIIPTE